MKHEERGAIASFYCGPEDHGCTTAEVIAYRCFAGLNDPIDAVRSVRTGKTFVLFDWRKKHWPSTLAPNRERRASIISTIKSLERRLDDERGKLERVDDEYKAVP